MLAGMLRAVLLALATLAAAGGDRPRASAGADERAFAAPDDLVHAARTGDLEAARATLRAGADVNAVRVRTVLGHELKETALFVAAREGRPEMVRLLLAAGADPDVRCIEDGTALTIAAARSGTAAILRALLDAGADVLGARPKGIMALGWSAMNGDAESFALLLRASRDAGIDADEEAAVLGRLGYRKDDLAHVLRRLLTWREDLAPALAAAARAGALADVERELAAGAAVSAPDDLGWTPLHWAAFAGSVATARRLLDAGADPDARTAAGGAPLALAARFGGPELARLLLDRGAAVDAADESGLTALGAAASAAAPETIRLLVERGADPDVALGSAATPRQIAESRKHSAGVDVRWALDGAASGPCATAAHEVELVTDLPAPAIRALRADLVRDPRSTEAAIEVFLELPTMPLDMAFEVYWREGGATLPVRGITVRAGTDFDKPYKLQLWTRSAPRVAIDLLLRPDPAAAMRDLPCPTAIWGREVRLTCPLVEREGD